MSVLQSLTFEKSQYEKLPEYSKIACTQGRSLDYSPKEVAEVGENGPFSQGGGGQSKKIWNFCRKLEYQSSASTGNDNFETTIGSFQVPTVHTDVVRRRRAPFDQKV